jgi:hypothetical protein
MKNAILRITIMAMASVFLNGCQRPDTDVTSSPEYNFSSFAGTVWKTKVKVAVEDVKQGGLHQTWLFTPDTFDPTDPKYRPVAGGTVVSVLPIGTRLRIERLMKDNGNWGGVRVIATLEDGTHSQKTIYVDPELLAKNRYVWNGWSSSTNWDGDPDILEK